MALCISTKQSDFRGYPFDGPWVETKTRGFTRNNCGSGQQGSQVMYSKTYSSDVSADHLQWLIDEDSASFDSAGQANANANGTCTTNCVTSSIELSTAPVAIDATRIWVSAGRYNMGVSTAIPKSYLGPSFPIGSTPLDVMMPSHRPVLTPYPHNSVNVLYQYWLNRVSVNPWSNYLEVLLYTKNTVGATACDAPTVRKITEIYDVPGVSVYHEAYATSRGIIFVSGAIIEDPNAGGPLVSGAEVYWFDTITNQTTKLYAQKRPSNHRYNLSSCAILYDGTTAYISLCFASSASRRKKRTRTCFLRVDFDFFGSPINTEQIVPFDYSNQRLIMLTGVYTGNRAFFLYQEDGSLKTYPIYGGSPASPPNVDLYISCKSVRDMSDPNVAYIGGYNLRILKYDGLSNTWTVLK